MIGLIELIELIELIGLIELVDHAVFFNLKSAIRNPKSKDWLLENYWYRVKGIR